MKSGIRDQMEGAVKDAKGAAKQRPGRATGDSAKLVRRTEGRTEGKFQKKSGEIKRDIMRE